MRLTVRRLDPDVRAELQRIAPAADGPRPTELLDGGLDGYVLDADGEPASWCAVAAGDDPGARTLTGFRVAPIYRHRQFARRLLEVVLEDLRAQGVERVEAAPEHGEVLDDLELWDDGEDVFQGAGFELVQDDPIRPVLRRAL